MNENNFNVFNNGNGIVTDNDEINRIIKAVEDESGAKLASAIPAVTFGEDPDEKTYLVLLTVFVPEEDGVNREWMIRVGRQATYDYLKDLVKYEAIDPNESFIIAGQKEMDDTIGKDNIILNQTPITVFRFLKVMREGHKILDGDEMFDINDFDLNSHDGDKTILDV